MGSYVTLGPGTCISSEKLALTMAGYSIDVELKGKFLKGTAAAEFRKKLIKEMFVVTNQLESDVARKTPVATGALRAGVTNEVKISGNVEGRVFVKGPAKRYAEVVEFGRRPGQRWPPPAPIRRWLRFSGKGKAFIRSVKAQYNLSDEKALERATYLKQRGIGVYGIKEKLMFKRAFKKRKKWVFNRFDKMIAAFVR